MKLGAETNPHESALTIPVMPPDESRQNLERFREIVVADQQLFTQLRGTADLENFVALAVQLGAERGCRFTPETVRAAIQERRRAWLERWL